MIDCIKCFSIDTKKHGLLKSGAQRYKCLDCHKTFIVGGRGTYSDSFKQKVVENYCHRGLNARELVKHYNISSRTLIKRSQHHKESCSQCSRFI